MKIAPGRNHERRRGIIFHPTLGYAIPPPIPLTVARRNARERTRVKTVNDIYECLRAHVPAAAKAKRLAKVDIIKHTIDYIQKLQKLVSSIEEPECDSPQYFEVDEVSTKPEILNNSVSCASFSSSRLSCDGYSPSCDNRYGSPGGYFQFTQEEKADQHPLQAKAWTRDISQKDIDNSWLRQSDHALLDVIADWQDS